MSNRYYHLLEAQAELCMILAELKARDNNFPETARQELNASLAKLAEPPGCRLQERYRELQDHYVANICCVLLLAEIHNCGMEEIARHFQRYFTSGL